MSSINGKTIPHRSWPEGSYWTDDGTANGTSLEYDGSSECAGFAKYIYHYIWGTLSGTSISRSSLTGTPKDWDDIKVGARLRCNYNGGAHSMVLIDKQDGGVVVYDCNWTTDPNKYCIIGTRSYSWANFIKTFTSITATVHN